MQVAVSGVSAVSHFHARRADLTLPADSGVTSISEVFTMTELKLFSARREDWRTTSDGLKASPWSLVS